MTDQTDKPTREQCIEWLECAGGTEPDRFVSAILSLLRAQPTADARIERDGYAVEIHQSTGVIGFSHGERWTGTGPKLAVKRMHDMVFEDDKRPTAGGSEAALKKLRADYFLAATNSLHSPASPPAALVTGEIEARKASGRWLAGQLDALKIKGNSGITAEDLLSIRLAKLNEVKQLLRNEQRLEAMAQVGWAISFIRSLPDALTVEELEALNAVVAEFSGWGAINSRWPQRAATLRSLASRLRADRGEK